VLVGLSVGVGNVVAVGSTVKLGVGVSVGNLRSAPTQEDNIKVKTTIKKMRLYVMLIFMPHLVSTYGRYIQLHKDNSMLETIQEMIILK
jgi:hypothetical protein